MNNHLKDNRLILIVPVIVLLLGMVPTTAFAQNEDQQQQTCPDGSQPDENGNCPSEQPSIHDQICNALQVNNIATLATLLIALHLGVLIALHFSYFDS
ncbi:MAG: hypothetical protein WBZ36_04550 [Candidatus Nitrosopolaris sp.]